MLKIAVFIEPENKTKERILLLKNQVKYLFGTQKYLNHPPHCTLFTMNVKNNIYENNNLKKSIKTSKSYINSLKTIIKNTGIFKNDPLTNGHTLYLEIKKNTALIKLQKNLINVFLPYRRNNKKEEYSFNLKWMKNNYKKYGYPFVGKYWTPHMTIASINGYSIKNKFFSDFAKQKFNILNKIKYVSVYKIDDDYHEHLWNINII